MPRLTCDAGVAPPRLERIMVREARIYEPCKPWHAQHCEISDFFRPHSTSRGLTLTELDTTERERILVMS